MAKIGSFGTVVFEVSPNRILTFDGLKRKSGSRWEEHEVIGEKPVPEFIGQTLDEITLPILLRASAGVDPKAELDKLRDFKDNGRTSFLIIGGSSVSTSQWYLFDMSETHKVYDGKGRLITAEVELILKEYPSPPAPTNRPTPKTTSSSASKTTNVSKRTWIGEITVKVGMLNIRMGPSLKARIKKVARQGQKYKVYGTTTTDITWYSLGAGLYISANPKYVSFKKG
jgi:phage protein U